VGTLKAIIRQISEQIDAPESVILRRLFDS